MRTTYAPPAKSEQYLTDKKVARQLVRSLLPELGLLAFQTRHGPKMTAGVAYCATYSMHYLRVLSVADAFATDAARLIFNTLVLPWTLRRIAGFQARNRNWPCVAVMLDGRFVEASCSEGGLFPSFDEVQRRQTLIATTADASDPGRSM